jgi:transcriptional regulator NrdR family protein
MQTASHEAIITFVNALFKTSHPANSRVEFPNTVTVTSDLKQIISDIEILINGKHHYHMEAQVDNDLNIALRMFEYGYQRGLKSRTADKSGVITVRLPKARVLYWETTKNAPDWAVLRLVFPDDTVHEYKIETFKVLNHTIGDLAKKKLLLLLPFSILKLRKQVEAAKTSQKRRELSDDVAATLKQVFQTLDAAEKAAILTKADKEAILDQVDILFAQIYEPFTEFKEVTKMVDTIILSRVEKAELKAELNNSLKIAKNLLSDGDSPEKVARNTGLPLAKVKALLKEPKAKRTA